MFYLIKVGSITNAQRASDILKRSGIKAYLGRNTNPSPKEGCGYTVKLYSDNINEVIAKLEYENIRIIEVESL